MLYFVPKVGNSIEWHVGDLKPYLPPKSLVLVQADGDELEYLSEHFTRLPWGDTLVVRWPQPWASFIYENLPRRIER